MGRRKNYTDDIIRVLVESLSRNEDLNIRQVAARTGRPYSTIFENLGALAEYGFVGRKWFMTERGTRPYVIVRLRLPGLLYAIYKSMHKRLVLSGKEEKAVISTAYLEVQKFLDKKYEDLREMFDADPWGKLCFKALCLLRGKGTPLSFQRVVMVNVAENVIGEYIDPEEQLTPKEFERIFRDEARLCDAILRGLKDAYRELSLLAQIVEGEICLEAFSEAFNDLAEYEKKDVMAAFRFEYDSLVDMIIRKMEIPEEIYGRYRSMRSEASLDQIVCLFECPKCGYRGPSIQSLEEILSSYRVKCPRCRSHHKLTHLPRYVDRKSSELFLRWARGHISRQLSTSIEKSLSTEYSSS